jgi:DNA-binding PadR family transcriptional regulator
MNPNALAERTPMPKNSQSSSLRDTFGGIFGDLTNAVRERVEDITSKANIAPTSKEALETAVLASLEGESKNAHQVLESLVVASAGKLNVTSGTVQSALNALVEREQAKSKAKGDRKVYSLTDAGKNSLKQAKADAANADQQAAKSSTKSMSFVSLDPKFVSSATKLGPVLIDIAQTGTREQQAKAVEILEKTRKQLHVILADD